MDPESELAGKSDRDKSRDELLKELRLLRDEQARLRASIARFEEPAGNARPAEPRGALNPDKRFLSDMLDCITDGICVIDRDLNIVRVNRTMEVWHQDMLPLAGKKCYYAYHNRTEACERCPCLAAMAEGAPRSGEVPRDMAGRTVGWQDLYSFPLRDDNGSVVGCIYYARDATERKRAEEALKASEEKFRVLAETTSAAICILQDGRFTFANPAMERISGFSREELASAHFGDLIHDDSREYVRELYDRWTRGEGDAFQFELKGVRRNGKCGWVYIDATAIGYQGGRAMLLTGIDITDLKRAEVALGDSRHIKTLLMNSIPECMFMLDRNGIIRDANSVFARYLGKSQQDLIGAYAYDLINPDMARSRKEKIEEVFRTGLPARFEDERAGVYFENIITPIDAGDGRVEKVAVIAIDITERKHVEAALREAKAQAELYLDLMGHDINNMHQISLGYLELARDELTDDRVREYIDRPIEVLQRCARLIRNVRKLQKLRGREYRPVLVDVAVMLREVQREYGAVPHKAVRLNLGGLEHCHVRANELLYDVFANLVSNAVKHTGSRADITISAGIVEYDRKRYYQVAVEDNGPGISDGFKDKVFNRMLKGTPIAKGMGLGLYLVKSLVDSYRGRVWVEDRVPGDYTRGAKFVVILPAAEE